jgi:hypothetical protein
MRARHLHRHLIDACMSVAVTFMCENVAKFVTTHKSHHEQVCKDAMLGGLKLKIRKNAGMRQ